MDKKLPIDLFYGVKPAQFLRFLADEVESGRMTLDQGLIVTDTHRPIAFSNEPLPTDVSNNLFVAAKGLAGLWSESTK